MVTFTRNRFFAYVGSIALAGGALLGVGSAAFADPPGCSKSINSFDLNSFGELTAQVGGSCGSALSRVLVGEIKHDLTARPDSVVTRGTDAGTRTFAVALQSCDNGNNATYYARVFFDGFTDYKDSSHKKFQTC